MFFSCLFPSDTSCCSAFRLSSFWFRVAENCYKYTVTAPDPLLKLDYILGEATAMNIQFLPVLSTLFGTLRAEREYSEMAMKYRLLCNTGDYALWWDAHRTFGKRWIIETRQGIEFETRWGTEFKDEVLITNAINPKLLRWDWGLLKRIGCAPK